MNKKIIAVLLSIMIVFGVCPVSRAAAYTAALKGNAVLRAGDTLVVTFSVYGSGDAGINGVQGTLNFDADQVTFLGASNLLSSGWEIDYNAAASGCVKFLAYDDSGENPLTQADVLSFSFRVSSALAAGTELSVFCDNVVLSVGPYTAPWGVQVAQSAYTKTLAAPLSDDTYLASLSVSNAALSPAFSADVQQYRIGVPYGTKTLSIDARARDEKTTVAISYSNALQSASPTVVSIVLTSEKGSKRTYTMVVDKIGAVYTVSSGKYKVNGTGTLTCIGVAKSSVTSLSIASTVRVANQSYQVVSIASNAFRNNKKLKKVTIGNSVLSIGTNAFYGCTRLSSVATGHGVRTIGANAFKNCTSLSSLTLGDGLTVIQSRAFYNCKKLKSVTIKNNCTTIYNNAFRNCTSLTKVTLGSSVESLGAGVFYNCKKLKTITIQSTVLRSVGSKALKGIYRKAVIKVPSTHVAAYRQLLKNKGQSKTVTIR